jgi:hypothetical protein
MPTATACRLDADQLAQYRRDGYTVTRQPVFASDRLAALTAHFERILAERPAGVRPEHLDVPHFTDLALFDWLFDDAVLDLVEPITGPDIALFSSHFICKPAGDGRRVPWHEDSAYWRGMMPDDRMDVVTVWLAIDPSTAANGAMRVIPGTHAGSGGFSEYEPVDQTVNVFDREIKRSLYDAKRAVTIELAPGQASLHHAKLMHGSEANRSSLRRCGFTMRYMSAAIPFDQDAFPHHQIYLARGRDRAGNRYGDPTRPAAEVLAARSGKIRAGH